MPRQVIPEVRFIGLVTTSRPPIPLPFRRVDFDVEGKGISVRMTPQAMWKDDGTNLTDDNVVVAAKEYVEMKIRDFGLNVLPSELVLDDVAMIDVRRELGVNW